MLPTIFIWYDFCYSDCFDIYLIRDTCVWLKWFLKTVEYDNVPDFENEPSWNVENDTTTDDADAENRDIFHAEWT